MEMLHLILVGAVNRSYCKTSF